MSNLVSQDRIIERLDQLNDKLALTIIPSIKEVDKRLFAINTIIWLNTFLLVVLIVVIVISIVWSIT